MYLQGTTADVMPQHNVQLNLFNIIKEIKSREKISKAFTILIIISRLTINRSKTTHMHYIYVMICICLYYSQKNQFSFFVNALVVRAYRGWKGVLDFDHHSDLSDRFPPPVSGVVSITDVNESVKTISCLPSQSEGLDFVFRSIMNIEILPHPPVRLSLHCSHSLLRQLLKQF